MVQLSEDGGVPGPSPATEDRRLMMQPSQLTGDNRPGVNHHHTHLAPMRPSATLPTAKDHHRGVYSCGNGAASNGFVACGSSREIRCVEDQMVEVEVDNISRFSSESRQTGNVKMRNEHPYPDSRKLPQSPYPDSRKLPQSRGRWSYYGDLRARQDQVFTRDPKDERNEIRRDPRDYGDRRERDRRDPRDYRGHRDDIKDPREYMVRRDLDRKDLRDRRDDRRDLRDRRHDRRDRRDERRYSRDDVLDVKGGWRNLRGEGGEPRSNTRGHREDRGEGRDSREARESHHQERKHEGEGASLVEHEIGDGQNIFLEGDLGSAPVKAEVLESKAADTGRSKDCDDIHERVAEAGHDQDQERKQGIDCGRGRNLGRDAEYEPLRREPVGEETGYESDHSRMSRTTAMTGYSTSSRSFNWRPRADSVVSQASVFSNASARPPPTPGRGTRDILHCQRDYQIKIVDGEMILDLWNNPFAQETMPRINEIIGFPA